MSYTELFRLLRDHGWHEVRQKGGHVIFRHPDRAFLLVVPNHTSKEVKTDLCQSILKKAGISTRKK